MCVLNSGSSKSCGKSPEIYFYWSPLDLFLKEFRLTFRLNSDSNWHTAVKDTTCYSVLYTFPYFYDKEFENADIGSGPGTKCFEFLSEEFHINICVKMGSEIKKNSLVFTSVILSPKHRENEESTGKVWENKTFQAQVFLPYFWRSRNPHKT